MSDPVEDAYRKSQENRTEYVEVESEGIVDKQLISDLKEIKGEINLVYSKLIANPYMAPDLVDDARSSLVRTVGLLMEYNIPLQHEGKKRSADDIIRESLAELGGLLGAKGAIAALRAKEVSNKHGKITATAMTSKYIMILRQTIITLSTQIQVMK